MDGDIRDEVDMDSPSREEDEERESAISNTSPGHIKAPTFADLRIRTDDKAVKHDHLAMNPPAVNAFSEEIN